MMAEKNSWTKKSADTFVATKYASHGTRCVDDLAKLNTHQIYDSAGLHPNLNPYGVTRECCDCEQFPETFPIILGLDVTGSMGDAAKACASQLNAIMESLYQKVNGVEFMMMGIGDLACDRAPIQATQFESDVRILDQTTMIFFEGGGGGNSYESYTAAWYFALHNTKLDCHKRGKKGVIITLGDETLNPYLPGNALRNVLGCTTQDVDTQDLYKEVVKKFDVYHIVITDSPCYWHYADGIKNTWGKLLGQRCIYGTCDKLPEIISNIVDDIIEESTTETAVGGEGISW